MVEAYTDIDKEALTKPIDLTTRFHDQWVCTRIKLLHGVVYIFTVLCLLSSLIFSEEAISNIYLSILTGSLAIPMVASYLLERYPFAGKYYIFFYGEVIQCMVIGIALVEGPPFLYSLAMLAFGTMIFCQTFLVTSNELMVLTAAKFTIQWAIVGMWYGDAIMTRELWGFLSFGVIFLEVYCCMHSQKATFSEIYKMHRSLKIAYENMETLMNKLPSGILVLDEEMNVVYSDVQAVAMLGTDEVKAVFTVKYATSLNSNKNSLEDVNYLFQNKITDNVTLGEIQYNGKIIGLSGSIAEWEGEKRVILILNDLTKTMKLEQEEKLSEEKSILLKRVSHDLGGPLSSMAMMLPLIKEKVADPLVVSQIELIQHSCDYLELLIDDLLDYSSIMAKAERICLSTFRTRTVIEDIIALMRMQVRNKGVALTYSIPPNIPKEIVSDARRIKEILFNLIGNSIKFTPRGTVNLSLSYFAHQLTFEVSDTGIGIPKDKLAGIFGAFERVDSQVSTIQGTGLGLFISNSLVKALGGEHIKVHSLLNKGSVFSFTISVDAAAAPDRSLNSKNAPIPTKRLKSIGTPNPVLIVDDYIFKQSTFSAFLQSEGYHSEIANNGQEAIEKVLNRDKMGKPYSCILMDGDMPILDGWETTKIFLEMKAQNRLAEVPPIIGTTEYKEERERCLATGMTDVLSMPCPKHQFMRILKQYITHNDIPS